jgi:hypothetical protein
MLYTVAFSVAFLSAVGLPAAGVLFFVAVVAMVAEEEAGEAVVR